MQRSGIACPLEIQSSTRDYLFKHLTIEMKNVLAFIFFSTLFLANKGHSQSPDPLTSPENAYTKTINERARKIVAILGIVDSGKALRVQSLIANQYSNLNTIHTSRDSKIKAAKASQDQKEAIEAATKKIEEDAAAEIKILHQKFLSSLSSELSNEQAAKVKDGMTYNVVNITYAGYLDMLPNLTANQKTQIMAWLVEAREQAMDAESSEKKHGWFGKYKGRINNYLSAAGYDLKKEGEAWQKRIKEKEKNRTTN
jgi:hypothetical protein